MLSNLRNKLRQELSKGLETFCREVEQELNVPKNVVGLLT